MLKKQVFSDVKVPSINAIEKALPATPVAHVKKLAADVKREIASTVDGTDDEEMKALENRPGSRILVGELYYKKQNYSLALPYFKAELIAIKTGDVDYDNRDEIVQFLQARITEINQKQNE